jgi:putative YphP/YqiW family bacilliredoxin
MYDPVLVQPMRDEVTRLGVKELRTDIEVEMALEEKGTALIFVNSVCGCAAGGARPALALALKHGAVPDNVYTVFAGNDVDATKKARENFVGYAPSSPQFGMFKDGELVFMLERWQIEGRNPWEIANALTTAFDQYCTKKVDAAVTA